MQGEVKTVGNGKGKQLERSDYSVLLGHVSTLLQTYAGPINLPNPSAVKLPDRACAVLYLQPGTLAGLLGRSCLRSPRLSHACIMYNVYVSETANDLLKIGYILFDSVCYSDPSTGVILELIRATSSSSTIRFHISIYVC